MIVTSISGLLFRRCPSAVPGFIVPIVVDPINTWEFWVCYFRFSHAVHSLLANGLVRLGLARRTLAQAVVIIALATAFEGVNSAQAVRITQALPDDSFIVEIAGKNYRAINADKVREIQKARIDLEAAQKINVEKDSQIAIQVQEIALLKKDVEIVGLQRDLFKSDFERSRTDAARNFQLFMTERALRQDAGSFIPRGSSHGFWGKVLDGLNSQAAQVGFKLVIPTAQAVRVFTRCQ